MLQRGKISLSLQLLFVFVSVAMYGAEDANINTIPKELQDKILGYLYYPRLIRYAKSFYYVESLDTFVKDTKLPLSQAHEGLYAINSYKNFIFSNKREKGYCDSDHVIVTDTTLIYDMASKLIYSDPENEQRAPLNLQMQAGLRPYMYPNCVVHQDDMIIGINFSIYDKFLFKQYDINQPLFIVFASQEASSEKQIRHTLLENNLIIPSDTLSFSKMEVDSIDYDNWAAEFSKKRCLNNAFWTPYNIKLHRSIPLIQAVTSDSFVVALDRDSSLYIWKKSRNEQGHIEYGEHVCRYPREAGSIGISDKILAVGTKNGDLFFYDLVSEMFLAKYPLYSSEKPCKVIAFHKDTICTEGLGGKSKKARVDLLQAAFILCDHKKHGSVEKFSSLNSAVTHDGYLLTAPTPLQSVDHIALPFLPEQEEKGVCGLYAFKSEEGRPALL
jgi:hypothetical protein